MLLKCAVAPPSPSAVSAWVKEGAIFTQVSQRRRQERLPEVTILVPQWILLVLTDAIWS